MATGAYRPADPLGLTRVRGQNQGHAGRIELPQQAQALDPELPLAQDELRIEVESLNIDSASFHQISKACDGNLVRIQAHIAELVRSRGKMHNPVTGSGGMLIGTVVEVGPEFPVRDKPVRVGDRIATLVSLSLTPLRIRNIKHIDPRRDRVDIEGDAVLFASGIFSVLPNDLPESLSLAALDVAGAPAQTRKLVNENDVVVVIGGGGKSGILCLFEAKRKAGVRTIALEYSDEAVARLRGLSFVDDVIQADARNPIEVMEKIWVATKGLMGDLVINVANVPETEMASVLSARPKGIVYFFSMATSFTRAALGAEGLGLDVDLRIGNGYTEGHADLTLDLFRESAELSALFRNLYA